MSALLSLAGAPSTGTTAAKSAPTPDDGAEGFGDVLSLILAEAPTAGAAFAKSAQGTEKGSGDAPEAGPLILRSGSLALLAAGKHTPSKPLAQDAAAGAAGNPAGTGPVGATQAAPLVFDLPPAVHAAALAAGTKVPDVEGGIAPVSAGTTGGPLPELLAPLGNGTLPPAPALPPEPPAASAAILSTVAAGAPVMRCPEKQTATAPTGTAVTKSPGAACSATEPPAYGPGPVASVPRGIPAVAPPGAVREAPTEAAQVLSPATMPSPVRPTTLTPATAVGESRQVPPGTPEGEASTAAGGLYAPGPPAQAAILGHGPASASPAAPSPVPPGYTAQLTKPIFTLASGGTGSHTVVVAMHPDSLGPVTVQANISSAGVRIELFASTPDGREILRESLPELKRDLTGTGLNATLDLSSDAQPGTGRDTREQFFNRGPTPEHPRGTDNPPLPINNHTSRRMSGLFGVDGSLDVMA